MDLVVRSPHGDADVSIDADVWATTLGDVVAMVTGQAVPAIVLVDDRVLPASTPLADGNVRVGSVLSTMSGGHDGLADPAVRLIQHAGRGAGTIRPLDGGRYRVGPGQRLSAPELSAAQVERSAFELEIDAGAVTVHPVEGTGVVVAGRAVEGPTAWTDGDLVVGGRVFGLEHPPAPATASRHVADADGTVPFMRAAIAGVADDRTVADAVQVAEAHGPALWRRRLHGDSILTLPIGLVDEGGASLRRVSLTVGPERGAALVGTDDFADALARAVVLGAATAHGPADLAVVVATTPDRAGHWDWVKWLPHARAGGEPSILATDTALARWADTMLASAPAALTLLVVDDPERWNRRASALRQVVSSPPPWIRLVVLCDRADRAPASCRTVVVQDGVLTSMTTVSSPGQPSPPAGVAGFVPALVDAAVAAETARSLACLADNDREEPAGGRHVPAPQLVLADALDSIGRGDTPDEAWIGRSDVGDRVSIDWSSTSAVSLRATERGDLDALAITVVAGLVAHHAPSERPILLVGDEGGAPLLDLLDELPHVAGRCDLGDGYERRRVLTRLEHVAASTNVGVVVAGRDIDSWSADVAALAERSPSVRLVTVGSGTLDGPPSTPRRGVVDIEVTRPAGIPLATMTGPYHDDGAERTTFTPVLPAPMPTSDLELRPFVYGRPLTSLERRLVRTSEPRAAIDDDVRSQLVSIAGTTAGSTAGVPVLVPPAFPAAVDLDDLLTHHEADAVPVGLADDTAHAELPVVWWQPGQAGTSLFVGSPRAGLDTVLWTILRGTDERSSPDDVRLTLIDSSSRRIAAAQAMPNVDLTAPVDRIDLAAAAIEHVAAVLRARQAEPPRERTASVLLVGDLTQLSRRLAASAFSPALDSLRAVAAGGAHGVNLVAIASTVDGTAGLLDVAEVFVGLLTDPDEVAALGLDEVAMSMCSPGRCWSRSTGRLVQLASAGAS